MLNSNPSNINSTRNLMRDGNYSSRDDYDQGEFRDYYPKTASVTLEVFSEDDLYYGNKVIWDGTAGKMMKADPEYIQHMEGNIFYPDKLAAVVSGVQNADERLVFTAPYGTANKIELIDVKESIEYRDDEDLDRPYTTGDEELDRYLVDPEEVLEEYADPEDEPELYAQHKKEFEEALQEALKAEQGDLGRWAVTVRDGNHRAFGALLAGEPYVYVIMAQNQYQDFKDGRSPELVEILE